jgi:GNAT superfamily N-acetyltransferase
MSNFDQIKPLQDKINVLLLDIKDVKPNLYREYTLIVDYSINGFIDLGAEYIKNNPQEFEIFLKKLNDIIKILIFIKTKENIKEILTEKKQKRDRCLRIADRKFDKPSAYKSGAVVRCRKGDIWKDLKEEILSSLASIEPYNDPDDEYSQDLDSYLEDDNINWEEESYVTLLNPNDIEPSEWNYLSDDYNNPKSVKMSKEDPKKFPPILVVKKGENKYEAIDGIHRVYAFRLNNNMIPAIVITPKLEQGLSTNDIQMVNFMFNKYKDYNIPIPTPINIQEDESLHKWFKRSGTQGLKEIGDATSNITSFITSKKYSKYFNFIGEYPIIEDKITLLDNNKEIGYIKTIYIPSETIEGNSIEDQKMEWMIDKPSVEGVYLNPEYRGKGLGERLYMEMKSLQNKKSFNLYKSHDLTSHGKKIWDKFKEKELVKTDKRGDYLQEDESLHKWFKRSGTPGKEGGWVDCNAPTRKDGKITGYKPCGRKEGEKRAKYPSCRPTPAKCKDKGKGKTWGKTK